MIREICKAEVFLAQKAEAATADDLNTAQDLLDTLIAHKDGCVGMAANMIGVNKRIIAFENDGEYMLMFNPVIVKKEGSVVGAEGCLSVPDYEGEVERASYVECEFTDCNGQRMLLQAHDLLAICIQHELDHLDGVLFIDKAQSLSPKAKEKPTDVVK